MAIAPLPSPKPIDTEPTWERYVAELARLGDLLELALIDVAVTAEAEMVVGRLHSVAELVRDRLSQLGSQIEADSMGWVR